MVRNITFDFDMSYHTRFWFSKMISMKFLRHLKKRFETKQIHPNIPDNIASIRERACKGYVLDQVLWGKILLDSIYMTPDPKTAFTWFEVAASSGYGPGHNMVGRCFHFGWGCEQNFLRAANSYAKAMNCGDTWGTYNLGILHMRGLGLPTNLAYALALFRDAAEKGHAKSMNLLARFIEEGWETERNPDAALYWYLRSAQGGDYRGQHNYATILVNKGEIEQALVWWRRALLTATSDILIAMHSQIKNLGKNGDISLLNDIEKRLHSLNINI